MLGLWATGEDTLGVEVPGQGSHPTVTTQSFASHSFATRTTDTLASTFIPGRISRGLVVSRSVSLIPAGQGASMFGGLVTAEFGEIEFGNPDGELDSLRDLYADGRPVRIKLGFSHQDANGREVVDAFDDFEEVFVGVAGAWAPDLDRAILRLRDPGLRLQDQIYKSRYRGTGGEEGDDNLTDKNRPVVLGTVYNAEPQLVSPGYQIYQIHGGPVAQINAVRDAGVELEFHADAASFDALVQLGVPSAHYATCLDRGYIKLGSLPVGTVTVDLHGDAGFPTEPWSDQDLWTDGTGWVSGTGPAQLAGHVALKVLLEYARIPYTEIDELSFTSVDNISARNVGLYVKAGESRTLESVLDDIGLSSGIMVGTNRMGKFAAFRLELQAAPSFTFTRNEIVGDPQILPLPYGVPWFEWTLGWRRSWTVQSGTELAGNVTEPHRQFVGQEFRLAKVVNDHIRAAHYTSRPVPTIESVLVNFTESRNEVGKRMVFYGLGRLMFRVTVKNVLFRLEIGTVVKLQLDRWGLDSGQNFVVTAVREDLGEMATEFTCFG